jgi:hypothetical protein
MRTCTEAHTEVTSVALARPPDVRRETTGSVSRRAGALHADETAFAEPPDGR